MEKLNDYYSSDSILRKNSVLEVRENDWKWENFTNYFVLKNDLTKEQVEINIKNYFKNVRKKDKFWIIRVSNETFKDIKDMSYIKI